jgi:putative oxidoreductase
METAMQTTIDVTHPVHPAPIALYIRVKSILNGVSWDYLVLPMRIAAFSVFMRSGLVKIADWSSTLSLFADEYKVPVLPPALSAYMATTVELGCSSLILIGLATRFSVLAIVGMIATIQIFVYPMAWPDHIQWLAFLLPILIWGPGRFALDTLVGRVLKVS